MRPDGTRRYRTVYVEVGGKNGKTELAGGIANLLLVGDGEIGGEGYALAAGMEQAKIVFGRSQAMAQYEPGLGRHLELLKTSTYCPELNAVFMPLAGTPSGKTGKSPSFVIGDELHEWPDSVLYTYITRGMGARRQPLKFLITTAGKKGGFGWEMHERMLKVRDGIIDDPETLVVIYAADDDDDWTDPATWRKANPNLGTSVYEDFLASECRAAQDSPRLEANFRSYHLNQWGQQAVKWLKMAKWNACTSAPDNPRRWAELEAELAHRDCWGALDLASTKDMAAWLLNFPPIEPGEPYVLVCRFFCPEEAIEERSRRDRVGYEKWCDEGALIATRGNVIDYDVIAGQVMADAEKFVIRGIGVDPWNATQVVLNLQDEGLPVVFFRQNFGMLNEPSKELERRMLKGQLDHGGHPVLAWMASNACVLTDGHDNIKPTKKLSTEKIDGIIAAVMATAEPSAEDEEANDLELYGIEVV